MKSQIILASSSPRRIEMLKNNNIEPVIIPPTGANETLPIKMNMEQSVMYLALKKARYSERKYLMEYDTASFPVVLIAADTIVYKNGIIGKPANKSEAEATLKLLRNTSHYVATGVAMLQPGETKRFLFYDVTEVVFEDYSDEDIQNYLKTDEPWDKAGSYAIQGAWGKHVRHVIGNYDNVIGFPWENIKKALSLYWTEIKI